MEQTDKTTYRRSGPAQTFARSCAGQIVILLIAAAAVLLLLYLSVPSDKKMLNDAADAICRCIEDNKLAKNDKTDDVVRNIVAIFADCDSATIGKNMRTLYKYNRIEVYRHTFYSTARIHNNYRPDGTRVAVGFLGIVFPTVSYGDIVMGDAPIRKDYNRKIIIQETIETDGTDNDNPDFGDTYDSYDGGGSAGD